MDKNNKTNALNPKDIDGSILNPNGISTNSPQKTM